MTRISALTALTSADGGDTLPILDVSATTTKKITKTALISDIVDGTLIANSAIKAKHVDLAVADQTARDALPLFDGLTVYRKDLDCIQQYNGSIWRTYSPYPLGAQRAEVSTTESTASLSYTKLTTNTDKVTVEIGASGLALVSFKAAVAQSVTLQAFIAVGVSGATTIAASTNDANGNGGMAIPGSASFAQTVSVCYLQTGLNPGNNTFDMYYATSTGTATFGHRLISVVPI